MHHLLCLDPRSGGDQHQHLPLGPHLQSAVQVHINPPPPLCSGPAQIRADKTWKDLLRYPLGVYAPGRPAFLAHIKLKVSNIVGLTALRLAFFMGYGLNKVMQLFLYSI